MLTRARERNKAEDLGINGKETEVKAAGSRWDHLRRVCGGKKNGGRACQSMRKRTREGQAEEEDGTLGKSGFPQDRHSILFPFSWDLSPTRTFVKFWTQQEPPIKADPTQYRIITTVHHGDFKNVSFLPVLAKLPSFLPAEKILPFPSSSVVGGRSSGRHFCTIRGPRIRRQLATRFLTREPTRITLLCRWQKGIL